MPTQERPRVTKILRVACGFATLFLSSCSMSSSGNADGASDGTGTGDSSGGTSGETSVEPSDGSSGDDTDGSSAEGVAGILDCPTIPLPAYGTASATTLSDPFRRSCATCHGGNGMGLGSYPAIPGELDEAAFIAKVRAGSNAMPAFDADFVTDAELAADYAALRELANNPGDVADPMSGPTSWTDAEVEQIYQEGLAVWRKPGGIDGQACTNCHSPDGVELAIIGFTDDEILRRGQMHVDAEDALTIRDFVHAQRRRLGIAETCSTDWRPFQPGGEVLAGDDGPAQDAAFLETLEQRDLLLATGEVVSLDDAYQAFAELQAVDLRRLPIGIPLPRWAEDKFDGPEHRDVNDYMPPVPTAPNDPEAYFALEDSYLADPTDEALYALLEANRTQMNDLGYVAENTVPSNPESNCGAYPTSTSWIMQRMTQPKRLSVLVAAHLFREEIRAPGSFWDRPMSPFPDAPVPTNPAFTLGAFAIEPPCYDDLTYSLWIDSFPPGFREELPESDLAAGVIENTTDRVTHVWMTLGQILDPTLIASDAMQSNKMHYWATRNFAQPDVHLPFLFIHRIAIQARYWDEVRGTSGFPQATGPFDHASLDWLHPLLANDTQHIVRGLSSATDPTRQDVPSADINRFKGNVLRMILLISRDLLQQGASLQADQNFDHCLGVTCQVEQMYGYVDALQGFASTPEGMAAFSSQSFDLDLYQADTRMLIAEVAALMDAAPKQ